MIPLECLPKEYQQRMYASGATRRKELRDFHLCDAKFCELARIASVKHATADAAAYNKICEELGYNIRVISSHDRVFAYKTDNEKPN